MPKNNSAANKRPKNAQTRSSSRTKKKRPTKLGIALAQLEDVRAALARSQQDRERLLKRVDEQANQWREWTGPNYQQLRSDQIELRATLNRALRALGELEDAARKVTRSMHAEDEKLVASIVGLDMTLCRLDHDHAFYGVPFAQRGLPQIG